MARTAWIKARTRRGSFLPGSRSTPEETSTPQGWRRWIASCTLPGRKPPATISLLMLLMIPAQGCTRSQSKCCPVPPRFSAVEESSRTPETHAGAEAVGFEKEVAVLGDVDFVHAFALVGLVRLYQLRRRLDPIRHFVRQARRKSSLASCGKSSAGEIRWRVAGRARG